MEFKTPKTLCKPIKNFDNSILVLVELQVSKNYNSDDAPLILKANDINWKQTLAISKLNDISLFTNQEEVHDLNQRLTHINNALYGNINSSHDGYEITKPLDQRSMFKINVKSTVNTVGSREAGIVAYDELSACNIFVSQVNTNVDVYDLDVEDLGVLCNKSPILYKSKE